ncbi:2-phospho-L-lactate transferase CofD family protein [Streptomyces pinistramenti]|uniref:2-phospho-L-lactate transferase CofD family protein n=1 Tax=Streptomyces pinistramenti TaxID=2884812 RepID=UPI001D05D904|nr:2-phospho-L-lactate transferase CofD family protein [Streptomyces pinistramenti]MCB5906097.1 2-phospho-L-lactate transferase CofD family protein [Streptomyces pinistramenti]
MVNVVGIGGGIGASRLWLTLHDALEDDAADGPSGLTLVVNTGDDLWAHGVRVCPDLDTTLYALSGRQDVERGWGTKGESWRCMEAVRGLGGEVWFHLGDTDLATHLLRTAWLREGVGLAEVTRRLAEGMGLRCRVLPATEQPVSTQLLCTDGERRSYQEFLVRDAAGPRVHEVTYAGIPAARPAPGVLEALESADLIVLGPSNPVASLGPVLAVPGIREAVRDAGCPVVAVTPTVSRVPFDDPGEARRADSRQRLMESRGVQATATGAAEMIRDLCDVFVLDTADAQEADAIRAFGPDVLLTPTLASAGRAPRALADAVLGAADTRRPVRSGAIGGVGR